MTAVESATLRQGPSRRASRGVLNSAHTEAITEELRHHVEQFHDRPDAATDAGDASGLSYLELDRRANRLAHLLVERGAVSGSRIGILLDPSPDSYVATLGALRAGASYVPLDPSLSAERMAFIAHDAQLSDLLTSSGHVDLTRTLPCPVVNLDSAELDGQSDRSPDIRVDRRAVACVIYTTNPAGDPEPSYVPHTDPRTFLRVENGHRDARPDAPAARAAKAGQVLIGAGSEQAVRWRAGNGCSTSSSTGATGCARTARTIGSPWTPTALGLTYPQLDGRANQLARHLLPAASAPVTGSRCCSTAPCMATSAMLAVLKINAAYVPLDVGFPADRLAYIVRDAGVRRGALAGRTCGTLLADEPAAGPVPRRPRRRGSRRWTIARLIDAERETRSTSWPTSSTPPARPAGPRAWRSTTPASATSSGSPPRSTASGLATACTRA